jgi:hypothetical protein
MSPEQVLVYNTVDARSDLYSRGMVFYNTLSGGYAFNGESFADVFVAICTEPLPDLRLAAPWVPGSVADWFQRACARDVQQRFQSADEMIEAMDRALGVSTGAFNRLSAPEVRLDTLRGHSPPIQHSLPRAAPSDSAPSDSGELAKGLTQVMSTDQALLKTGHANSAHTLDPELAVPKSSRLTWIVGGVVALLLLLGGALLLGQGNGVLPTSAVVAPPSGHMASAAVAAPAPSPAAPIVSPALAQTTSENAGSVASAAVPARAATSSKAGAVRVTGSKPAAVVPARANKAVPKGSSPVAASPRNTSTDMGF